jgi:hypothetical protein
VINYDTTIYKIFLIPQNHTSNPLIFLKCKRLKNFILRFSYFRHLNGQSDADGLASGTRQISPDPYFNFVTSICLNIEDE